MTASPSRFIGKRPTHVDLKLAIKPAFLLSVGAGFLQAGGHGLPMTFLSEYSVAVGYSATFGATLLAISNGVNAFSRVATGYAGDRFGRQNTLVLTVLLCAISVLAFWLRSIDLGGNRILWIFFVVVSHACIRFTQRSSLATYSTNLSNRFTVLQRGDTMLCSQL